MKHSIPALTLLALLPSALMAETFSTDVWADNWFEMRMNGEQVAEDSVPITTERFSVCGEVKELGYWSFGVVVLSEVGLCRFMMASGG